MLQQHLLSANDIECIVMLPMRNGLTVVHTVGAFRNRDPEKYFITGE